MFPTTPRNFDPNHLGIEEIIHRRETRYRVICRFTRSPVVPTGQMTRSSSHLTPSHVMLEGTSSVEHITGAQSNDNESRSCRCCCQKQGLQHFSQADAPMTEGVWKEIPDMHKNKYSETLARSFDNLSPCCSCRHIHSSRSRLFGKQVVTNGISGKMKEMLA